MRRLTREETDRLSTQAGRGTPPKWQRVLLWGSTTLLLVALLAAAGFVAWAIFIPAPMPEAVAALASDAEVTVTTQPWLTFTPTGARPTTGLIIYPGGRVDARAYAPAANEIARFGILVVIVPMPLNLAVIAPSRGQDVIDANPAITQWYIAGHSLGGAMAANFVYTHPDCCAGLILWAAYPANDNDLSTLTGLQVASIYGTLDGLATPAKVQDARPLLPAATRFVPIAGGNHAQFGWYGPQRGDNPATIPREEQQNRVVQATLSFIQP